MDRDVDWRISSRDKVQEACLIRKAWDLVIGVQILRAEEENALGLVIHIGESTLDNICLLSCIPCDLLPQLLILPSRILDSIQVAVGV